MKLVWLQVIPLLPRDASASFADLWRWQMCESNVASNSSAGGKRSVVYQATEWETDEEDETAKDEH